MIYKFIQEYYNEKFVKELKKKGIQKLKLINIGNSIASGYTRIDDIKPLIARNDTLENVLKYYGISYESHNFSRAQNNNDEHFYEWLVSNTKESTIYDMNRKDYTSSDIKLPNKGLSSSKMEEYYPKHVDGDLGLQDALLDKSDNLASIVIYNGCTGSFLDGITRDGTIKQKLLYGIHRDITSLEAILKWIQIHNRKGNSKTQVYLCGVPNYMGLKTGEVINHHLKRLAKDYANVIYVEPKKASFFYKGDGKIKADIHYDEAEYALFMNHIMDTITNNYELCDSMIHLDREFYQFSRGRELYFPDLNNEEYRTQCIEKMIQHELEHVSDKKEFLKRIKKYIMRRFPYDFYYLGKDSVQKVYKKISKE